MRCLEGHGGGVLRAALGMVLAVLFVTSVVLFVHSRAQPGGDGLAGQARQSSELEQDGVEDGTGASSTTSSGVGASGTSETGKVVADVDCSSVADITCPLTIPGARACGRRSNGWGMGWTFLTDASASEVASSVLTQFQEQGRGLVCATQMDLFGDAWGCVANGDNRVLLVHAAPEVVAIGSDSGQLSVAVVSLEADHAEG